MGQIALGASPYFGYGCTSTDVRPLLGHGNSVVLVAVFVSTRLDKSFPSLCVHKSSNNNNDNKVAQSR